MRKATLIRKLDSVEGVEQRLYHLKPAMADDDGGSAEYVVVSTSVLDTFSGPETYVFAANAAGEITSFESLDGSFKGALDHERALREAGYEVEGLAS